MAVAFCFPFIVASRRAATALAASLSAVVAFAAAASPTWAAAATVDLTERVRACTACHGRQGRATSHGYFPRIAGKPAAYLYNQLVNFRDGRRSNPAMSHLVAYLSDDYLREIAAHFAALDLPYPPPQTSGAPPAVLARGEALVRRGDAARGIPACSACHGAAMTGVVPSMPGLLGLPRDYVAGQFGAWAAGQRRAVAPDCMARIARRLTPDDVGAVATWLSSQPLPQDARPAAAFPLPLPLDCGSGTGR